VGLLTGLLQKVLQGAPTLGEVNQKAKVMEVAELETNELNEKGNQLKIALVPKL